jgi:hypothetical protein
VGSTNLRFVENHSELLLSADVSTLKLDKLVTICEYSDRFRVGQVEYEGIVNGMDWELKMLGELIARCIDGGCVKNPADTGTPNEASAGKTNPNNFVHGCCKNVTNSNIKVSQDISESTEMFPRSTNIPSRAQLDVAVDSKDGTQKSFPGRLFNGSWVSGKCNSPYKITSTNNDVIDIQ